MRYRHSHHAGNFADTLKHFILIELLKALARKPTPFCYLETHAGRGRYGLSTDNPDAGSEFRAGFGRLHGQTNLPEALSDYVSLVRSISGNPPPDAPLHAYPGSPLIAAALLRSQDRAVLFELNSNEADILKDTLRGHRNIHIHNNDGYTGLRGHLPPRERRGLVLIDPPYELQEQEFPVILDALRAAYERWPTGIYAIWYPIKQRTAVTRFHASLEQSGIRKILAAQLCLFPDDSRVSLNGCGMAVVNPPWQLDQTLGTALSTLHRLLGGLPGTGADCRWIVPE